MVEEGWKTTGLLRLRIVVQRVRGLEMDWL